VYFIGAAVSRNRQHNSVPTGTQMHTHTYIHTYIHTFIYLHVQYIHTGAYIHTHINIESKYIHTHTYSLKYTYIHTYIHAYIRNTIPIFQMKHPEIMIVSDVGSTKGSGKGFSIDIDDDSTVKSTYST
jgi:hypothetical protein